jgi:sugar O-acyltransferase (sialic acid O-acetyltransferase NeuD family)
MKEKEKIILVGGGGHCKSSIDVIEAQGLFEIAGIVDLPENVGKSILGYKILWTDEDIPLLTNEYKWFIITIGQIETAEKRKKIAFFLEAHGAQFPTIISPYAVVSPHATVGEGTIIFHHAVVNANASIGRHCIINTKALVEHDAVVEDFCHISTGAILNGGVVVGEESFVGSNSVTKQGIFIPPKSFIKANFLVK